ncbi:MAG: NnrU family protein [Planctomycetota bacterium]
MKRLGVLLYGVIVYAIFLPTFCYAIGFVSDLVVPKGINDGEPTSLLRALLINGGLLSLFAVQHNIMARPAFKRVWTKIVPEPMERSTFVLFTCGILALMFWQWRPMNDVIWSVESPVAEGMIWALCGIGWATVLISTFIIDHFDLFGLKQTVLYGMGREYRQPRFKVTGLYRFVRHPLMLGFFIAFWSAPTMTSGRLMFASITTIWILITLHIEERDLVGIHGNDYRQYQRNVPMVLPIPKRGESSAPIAQS